MDYIEFHTKDNKYKITISKKLKAYSAYKYTRYNINISIYDYMNNIIDSINTSEINLLSVVNSLDGFWNSLGETYSDIIYFDREELYSHYFVIELIDAPYMEDLESDIIGISLYKRSVYGDSLKLFTRFTTRDLESLIVDILYILEDIEYIHDMSNEIGDDYFMYYTDD
jgi:hypothetical protein